MQEVDFLLTGGSGFLGKIIRETLSPIHQIKTLDRSTSADVRCDLAMETPSLEDLTIKTVIHAAGKAHVIPKTNQEAEEFFQLNFQGTVHLTKALERMKQLPQHFIFISTVAVYGREEGIDIDENHPLNGSTPYAQSKIKAESFLSQWCGKHNVRLTVLRLPLVVGNNPPGNLGAIIRWMRRRLYIGIGSGNAKRSMVLGEDVTNFIPAISVKGGIYNLTDGYHPSVKEIEQTISKELKLGTPFRLPEGLVKTIARTGDFLGSWFPLNSTRYQKLTSSLTFSDTKARLAGWNPRPVIHNLRLK